MRTKGRFPRTKSAGAEELRRKRGRPEAGDESGSRYKALVENARVGIFEVDLVSRKLVAANDFVCRETGYTRAELLSMDAADLLEGEDQRQFLDRVRRMAAGETVPDGVEYRIRTKAGESRWALLNTIITRENGVPARAQVIATEITRRKQAEAKLAADLAALTRMHDISVRMLEAASIPLILQEVLDAAVAITGAQHGTLQLLEQDSLRIVAHHGHERSFLDIFAAAENRVSVCGEAMRRGERVVVEDLDNSSLFAGSPSLAVLREAGVRAIQATPLIARSGERLGILSTQWVAPHHPDEDALWRIDLLARQAADLIETSRSEQALRESEGRFRALNETSPIGVGVSSSDGVLIYANPAYESILGYGSGELLGRKAAELYLNPDDRASWLKAMRNGQAVRNMEVRLRRQDGVPIWVSINTSDISYGGKPAVMGTIQDITSRKDAEERMGHDLDAMRHLHRLGALSARGGNLDPVLREIVDAAIAISRADFGNIQLLDPASGDLRIAAHRGYPSWWIEFWNSVAKGKGACGTALERGERVIVEDVERSAVFAGTPALDIQLRAGIRAVQSTPLIGRSGQPVGMFSTHYRTPRRPDERALRLLDLLARQAADVIENTQAAEVLRESRAKYRDLIETTSDFIWEIDPQGRYTYCSPQMEKLWGLEPERMIGKTPFDQMPPGAREEGLAFYQGMAGAKSPFSGIQVPSLDARGHAIMIEISGVPFFDDRGELLGYRGITRDVTERERALKELASREALLRALTDNSPDAIYVKDTQSRWLMANPAVLRIVGKSAEEALGKTDLELYTDPAIGRAILENDRRVLEGKAAETFEEQADTLDGRRLFLSTKAPWFDSKGGLLGLIGISRDISERKRAEGLRQALAEQEKLRLGAAVEQASDAIVMVDLDGTIRYVNGSFESINGVTREVAVGSSYFDLPASESETAAAIREAVAAGRPWQGLLNRSLPEGRLVELKVTVSPARDPSGAVIGGLVTEKDVTRENALQGQVRQAQKMEALGTLAGGITHDFNNILGTVILNTELALMDLGPTDPARRPLPLVLQAANRGRELVKQIITFSRQRTWEKKPAAIAPIVREGMTFLRTTLAKDILIEETVDGRTGVVLADPSHINQILVNLCQNAAIAMRDHGGTLRVDLAPVEIDEAMILSHPNLRPGPYVRLTVSDTGCGMMKEIQERIFEPFFTTRGPGEGSGLGLAVVHGIIRTYDGEVTVESEPGKGSTFSVYLPRVDDQVPATDVKKREQTQGGKERILLVEDEKAQRESLQRGFGAFGYKVTAVADGRLALEAFRKDPAAFDMVITDQIMPRMTGLELAAEIMALRPDTPVILCTGFSEKVNGENIGRSGIRELLMKPFTFREAASLIRKVLG